MSDFNITVAEIIGSGLFASEDEPHFSHRGCDNHTGDKGHDGLGATVYDIKGYPNLDAARRGEEYDFQVCGDCLNELYYGRG